MSPEKVRLPNYWPMIVAAILVVCALAYRYSGDLTQPKATLLASIFASTTVPLLGIWAYRFQKNKDRELEIEAEERKAVSALVSAIEEVSFKVRAYHAVGLRTVPYFIKELSAVEAAVGVVRMHDLNEIADEALNYRSILQQYRLYLVREKRQRKDYNGEGKRPEEYDLAMKKSENFYRLKVIKSRQRLFDEAKKALPITGSIEISYQPIRDEDNGEEATK